MPLQPHITIRLEGNGRSFPPGTTLRGEYWLEGVSAEQVKAIELSVLWHTEGKGEEDLAVHFFRRQTISELRHSSERWMGSFCTQLPRSPLSYQGLIVKIVWCVRLRVFLTQGKQVVEEVRFRLGSVWTPKGSLR